jgi:hypothetical protein
MMRRRINDPSQASQTPAAVHPLIARALSHNPRPAFQAIRRNGFWEYVAAESCDAGVGGLLLDRIRELNIEAPASAVRQMQAYRDYVAAANAYKIESVQRVLARLQLAGVPCLLLKGAALNATIYEPGRRPTTDIDVLVHETDARMAERVLGNAGCRPGADLVRPDFFPRYYCEREYATRRTPSVKIDLHCRPFHVLRYGRTVPDRAMWANAREVRFGETTALIPGPEEMLIHLAVHAACHGNTELRWLHDIKAWIERYASEIDAASIADKCRRWGLSLPVHRALRKVRDVFELAGNEVINTLVTATKTLAGPLDRLALAGANLYPISPPLFVLCNAITAPGIRFRLGYLAATTLPDPAHLAQLYHRRHPGWQIAAHAIRLTRCLRRAASPE